MRSPTFTDGSAPRGRDGLQTPRYALAPLYTYLDSAILRWYKPFGKKPVIWESACGPGNLVKGLRDYGYDVNGTDLNYTGNDFFNWQPSVWDIQVTNPPFSLKYKWLARSYQLRKPFALLLPVETMGVASAQNIFKENISTTYPAGVEIILMNQRVNYKTPNTSWKDSRSWFPSAWYTWGLNIGIPLTYGTIDNTSFSDSEWNEN